MSSQGVVISKRLGLLVVLLCLGFVVHQLSNLNLDQIQGEDWLALAKTSILGGVAYGFISLILSFAWRKLLQWSGEPRAPIILCHAIYARTQIAKYLPGNIFSIAGRHLLGRKNGLRDSALAWAATLEILGMVFASGLVFALAGIYWSDLGMLVEVPVLICAVLVPLVLPWSMSAILQRIPRFKTYSLPHKSTRDFLRLYLIFILYLPWLVGAAAVLWMIIEKFTGAAPDFLIVLGISSGAWLAGYVIPGASGGIGVREALLIVALKPLIGESIVLITVMYRLATIIADIVYFLLGLPFPLQPLPASSNYEVAAPTPAPRQ